MMNSFIFSKNGENEDFLKKALPQNRIILCAVTTAAVIVESTLMLRVLF